MMRRRMVNGHLDRGGSRTWRPGQRVYYGRLGIVVGILVALVATNPANREWFDRVPKAWKRAGGERNGNSSYSSNNHRSSKQKQPPPLNSIPPIEDWGDYAQKIYRAYQLLTSDEEEYHVRTSTVGEGAQVNFGVFSVRIKTKRGKHPRMQLLGAGKTLQCNLQQSILCRLAHDFLIMPRHPTLRRCSKTTSGKNKRPPLDKLQDLDSILSFQEPQDRRYYRAYKFILSWIVCAFLLSFVTVPVPQHEQNPLIEALSRGFWPNPQRLLSSTFVMLLDLWLFLAPALAMMDEQITNQAQGSIFRLTEADSDWNYAFAVAVFWVLSSGAGNVMGFLIANWQNLGVILGGTPHPAATMPLTPAPPRIGYGCDVWAATALGYLRAFCKEDAYSNIRGHCITLFGAGYYMNWQMTIVSAIWMRIGFQILVVNESFLYLFSSIGLWLASDTVGNIMGEYHLEHHFAIVALSNFMDGFDKFWNSMFAG